MQTFINSVMRLGWIGRIAFLIGGVVTVYYLYTFFFASGFGAAFLLIFVYSIFLVCAVWFLIFVVNFIFTNRKKS